MNKKYDVYGLGNALVDLVLEVDDKFVSNYNIEKGLMTLVDEDRQSDLIGSLKISDEMMQCGGSAANTIIATSQFGGKCFYSCKVANDSFGRFYLKDLEKAGVTFSNNIDDLPAGTTGKCLVMVTPDAERTMNTFLGITSTFNISQLNAQAIKESEYIYIEGYLITSEEGKDAMIEAKRMAIQNGVKTALTFSDPSMVKYFGEGMKEVVGTGVDLLFCNEEEAMTFTETKNVLDAREKLKLFAKTFAITQGKNGAIIFDGDTFIDIEPYPVEAIDTNGAGDLFAGAFLFGITNGHSYAQAGKLASLASSKVVSKFGPRLESHQAMELLEELTK